MEDEAQFHVYLRIALFHPAAALRNHRHASRSDHQPARLVLQRGLAAAEGQPYEPAVGFGLSGQANGKQPYWGYDYKDVAPRIAFAYSPKGDDGLARKLWGGAGKTSIRAGYGIYFDHFGEGITNTFDRNGSFGLTTAIDNAAGIQTPAALPGSRVFTTFPPPVP